MIAYQPIITTLNYQNFKLDVLRLDLIDQEISGNKWFKLNYNLKKAQSEKAKTIITFGGAYSNHIAATAAFCKLEGFQSVGVIRGEAAKDLNPTLAKAKADGMQLHFVSRELYNQKSEAHFKQELTQLFGQHYLIPEGGNNEQGILGCMEILKPEWDYDTVVCACGTAATFSGIVAACKKQQRVIGISVLKGQNTLVNDALQQLKLILPTTNFIINGNEELAKSQITNHCITNNYCFNGYAKLDRALLKFKIDFEKKYTILLDYVYTSKLFYSVFDLLQHNKINLNAKILVIHCGGLQGNKGFEERYGI